ncbi:MAG: hypothetical protein WC788_02360 [Candidatus Paceibacterota bacterium]|jgi:cation:H+ antiporter
MDHALAIIALIASFYFLGKAADLIITNIRAIGEKLGIQIFFLGIILGFLTSLPELFLGINAIVNGVPEVSLGNLLGGTIVLFGLILGLSIFYNRRIKTNGNITDFAFAFVYMIIPLFLGLDGRIGPIDAFILITVYIYLLYIFYIDQKKHNHLEICITSEGNEILKKILMIVVGIFLVIMISNVIMNLFVYALNGWHVSIFIVGLIMFSLGTNLPELIVALRSYHNKLSDLSMSNIIGSAISNIVIIGVFALFRPFQVEVNMSYFALIFFSVLIYGAFLYFYRTDNVLTGKEGLVLILIYLLFLATQIGFLAAS